MLRTLYTIALYSWPPVVGLAVFGWARCRHDAPMNWADVAIAAALGALVGAWAYLGAQDAAREARRRDGEAAVRRMVTQAIDRARQQGIDEEGA